ncbi:hypothetical protein DL93DRAFT_1886471 [Clavulina sp. PMI_390]|nr:hypothetical protein DL93DRAFT_1886471 [Clavulina sp. PMI_390]
MPLQHARNPDQISRMPPNNLYLTAPNHEPRILSANSSPSAGTFPQTPQQHLSPAQTTLSIESAPTSLVDDSIAYGYTAHPLQGRMPVPHSPRSSATVDDPYNLYLRRQVAPTAPSVASAPPTRQTFDLPPQPLRRWSPVGNGVAKEVALRRFRSATPTVGGAQMVMKSTVDHPAQMRSTSSPSHLGLLFPGHGEALPTQYPPPPPAYTPSGISLQAPQALNFHYNSASPISRPPSGSHPAMNGSQPPMPSTSPYQAFEGGNGPEAFAASFYGGQQVAESMSGPPHPAMLPATARPPVTPIATGYPVLMPAQQPLPSPSTYGHPSGPSYPVYPPYSS